MKFGIIIGSHRSPSQSAKVGRFVERRISVLNPTSSCYVLDLGGNPLPLWDESMWSEDGGLKSQFASYSEQLAACSAFVLVSPEWGGMVPAALKNLLLLCGANELAHKPAMIIGVSASKNGSYPVAELRMSGYKNTHLVYIPDHVIVRDVEKVLNSDTAEGVTADETYLRSRLDYSLKMLAAYGEGLAVVRESGVVDLEKYPFGM